MKLEIDNADLQPIENFPLLWRWTQASHIILSPEVLAAIRPLTETKAEEIRGAAEQLHRYFDILPDLNERSAVSGQAHHDFVDTSGDDTEQARSWLRSQPVENDPAVVIVWRFFPGCAVLSKWRIFCEYWDDFCYPVSDDVLVWPLSGSWALEYRHFEVLRFGDRLPGERIWEIYGTVLAGE